MFAQEVAAVLQGLLRLEGKHGKYGKLRATDGKNIGNVWKMIENDGNIHEMDAFMEKL